MSRPSYYQTRIRPHPSTRNYEGLKHAINPQNEDKQRRCLTNESDERSSKALSLDDVDLASIYAVFSELSGHRDLYSFIELGLGMGL